MVRAMTETDLMKPEPVIVQLGLHGADVVCLEIISYLRQRLDAAEQLTAILPLCVPILNLTALPRLDR